MTKQFDRVIIPETIRQQLGIASQDRQPLVPQLIQRIKPYVAQQARHNAQARGKNKGPARQKR